jgi:hypothetical protein
MVAGVPKVVQEINYECAFGTEAGGGVAMGKARKEAVATEHLN